MTVIILVIYFGIYYGCFFRRIPFWAHILVVAITQWWKCFLVYILVVGISMWWDDFFM